MKYPLISHFPPGVLPFIEELLRRKSQVILCANSRPILNDVTYAELSLLLSQVADISPVIRTSLDTGLLVARDSGQGSPCLDLARMNFEVSISSHLGCFILLIVC